MSHLAARPPPALNGPLLMDESLAGDAAAVTLAPQVDVSIDAYLAGEVVLLASELSGAAVRVCDDCFAAHHPPRSCSEAISSIRAARYSAAFVLHMSPSFSQSTPTAWIFSTAASNAFAFAPASAASAATNLSASNRTHSM